LRDAITSAAVRAAKAAAYRGAGTIEFLLEGTGDAARFYFLEMNTRLQVEHPITEQVLGVDLVRAQLLVAAGERLPWTQYALAQRGHAIEARVYAEDPSQNFMPQAGPLLLYREPRMPGVRIDSGVAEGGEVTVHYDPLIAKVIATAETRELARQRLTAALRAYPILGIRTNIPFLLRVLDHPRFVAGDVDTGFLDGEGSALGKAADMEMPPFVRAALDNHKRQESGVPTVDSRLSTLDSGPSTLDSGLSTLDCGLSTVDSGSSDPWVRLKEWRV
jgi:acetyl/propionyl-CoA carboxylase alpha subunit